MAEFQIVSIQTAVKADMDHPRHSEASVIELKDGSLLMAWQCHMRSEKGSGDEAPSNISLMNSYDNGVTWENRRIVAEMNDGCVNCYSPSFFRAQDGSIVLLFKRYTQLEPGKLILNSLFRIASFDEGETWSEEETVWENNTENAMNHTVRRLSDGTLIVPAAIDSGAWCVEDHSKIVVFRSDDDLRHYTKSNVIDLPMRGAMEPCIAERPDGSLNMVMRTQLGSVFYSESFDGGRTWSPPQTTGLYAPESCPYIFTVPGSDAQVVIWNNSTYDMNWGGSHFGKRSPLTLAISRDGLRTFEAVTDIETDPGYAFTNPSVTVTSSGLCVMNYWTCKYSDKWIMDGLIDLKVATFRVEL